MQELSPEKARRFRRWRLMLFVFVPLAGLASLELVLRAADPEFLRPINIRFENAPNTEDHRLTHMFMDEANFVPDPVLLWRRAPGSLGHNVQGWRGPVINFRKRGAFRIFFLGDSNTQGVAWESFATFVQHLLAPHKTRDGRRYEVIGAGVAGYTSYQGLKQLDEIMKYEPDLVVVSFGFNDLARVTGAPDKAMDGLTPAQLALRHALFRFKTVHLFRFWTDRLSGSSPAHPQPRVSPEDYRANLAAMKATADRGGSAILFLTRPYLEENSAENYWKDGVPRYNEILRATSAEMGARWHDAFAIFEGRSEAFHENDDCHLTEEAHLELARTLIETHPDLFGNPVEEEGMRRRDRSPGP